jgi:hypothetical protein
MLPPCQFKTGTAATSFPESGRGHGLELSIDQLLDASAGNAGGLPQVATLSIQNRPLAAAAIALPESGKGHGL